jgi:hypothetical protein
VKTKWFELATRQQVYLYWSNPSRTFAEETPLQQWAVLFWGGCHTVNMLFLDFWWQYLRYVGSRSVLYVVLFVSMKVATVGNWSGQDRHTSAKKTLLRLDVPLIKRSGQACCINTCAGRQWHELLQVSVCFLCGRIAFSALCTRN